MFDPFFTFGAMQLEKSTGLYVETAILNSVPLGREVRVDFYLPVPITTGAGLDLLLINDGQDLITMGFEKILASVMERHHLKPLICVGIHCGEDRKNEYGMLAASDYLGRGSRAIPYRDFILTELLPFIHRHFNVSHFDSKSFAGFSLGGLNAMDLVWNYPQIFERAGVFSGSLWWRSKDKNEKDYNESVHRIMHHQVRSGQHLAGLKFYFQCGELDEKEDRNHNGVIDSIDDTIDLMRELQSKGYREGRDMKYVQLRDGKHDVPTWAKAWPEFLIWGWAN